MDAISDIFFHVPGQRVELYPYKLLVAGNSVMAPNEKAIRRRYHSQLLIFTIAGRGRIELQGNTFAATEGSVVWLDTSAEYAHGCDPTASNWIYKWISFHGYSLDRLFDIVQGWTDPVFRPREFKSTKSKLERILKSLGRRQQVSDSNCSAVIAEILASLVADRRDRNLGGAKPDVLGSLFHAVRRDVARKWCIADFANYCNVSSSQLYRIFKKRVGTSPMDWLRHERIVLAKQQLVQTDDRIAAVALRCGYPNPYHFSRDFRRGVGMPPTKFRRIWK